MVINKYIYFFLLFRHTCNLIINSKITAYQALSIVLSQLTNNIPSCSSFRDLMKIPTFQKICICILLRMSPNHHVTTFEPGNWLHKHCTVKYCGRCTGVTYFQKLFILMRTSQTSRETVMFRCGIRGPISRD